MVSQILSARLSTVSRRPQYGTISSMKGRPSNAPCSSSVARISAALLTSTRSPDRRGSFRMLLVDGFAGEGLGVSMTVPDHARLEMRHAAHVDVGTHVERGGR